jgi:hypothetical protein
LWLAGYIPVSAGHRKARSDLRRAKDNGKAARSVADTSIYQTVGSTFGYLTALFVLWDRFAKDAPYVVLKTVGVFDGGDRFLEAQVFNPRNTPIVVRARNREGDLRPTLENSIRSVVHSAMGHDISVAIDPGGSHSFPLIMPNGYNEMEDHDVLSIRFRWASVQSWVPGFGGFLIGVSTTKGRLETLLAPQHHDGPRRIQR